MERDKFFNTAFSFEKGAGHFKIHNRSFFPEAPRFGKKPGMTVTT